MRQPRASKAPLASPDVRLSPRLPDQHAASTCLISTHEASWPLAGSRGAGASTGSGRQQAAGGQDAGEQGQQGIPGRAPRPAAFLS